MKKDTAEKKDTFQRSCSETLSHRHPNVDLFSKHGLSYRDQKARWFVLLYWLTEGAPAKQALTVFQNIAVKMPQGNQRKTLMKTFNDDLDLNRQPLT